MVEEDNLLEKTPISALNTFWTDLTQPHAAISQPESRRRARMLSTMLLGILGIGIVSLLFVYLNVSNTPEPVRQADLRSIVFGTLFLLGGYFLSRTAYTTLTAIITIMGILASVFYAVFSSPTNTAHYPYLIFAGLLGGLFLPPLETFFIFVLATAGLVTLPIFFPEVEFQDLVVHIFFILSSGCLVLLGALVRKQDIAQMEEQAHQLSEREGKLVAAIRSTEDANLHLSKLNAQLEQHSHEELLLTEMVDLLQASRSEEEAVPVIHQSMQRLFPHGFGVLFLLNSSMNMVEAATKWGERGKNGLEESVISAMDCWALRRGRIYFIAADEPGTVCKHLGQEAPLPFSSMCLPMMAQSETLGILHLRFQPEKEQRTIRFHQEVDHLQNLASRVADQISLALSNIRLRESLQKQAIRDPLTGLFNRRYLEETLDREIRRAERKNIPLSILMLDIDHFKTFNDSYGHEAGDLLLREFGIFLKKKKRGDDIACRYGGEEFTMILPEVSSEVARERAETICEVIKQLRILFRGEALPGITLSIGIATFPIDGIVSAALLRIADQALYRAKALGRDRIELAQE